MPPVLPEGRGSQISQNPTIHDPIPSHRGEEPQDMIVLRDDDEEHHRALSIDDPDNDRLIFEISRFDVAPIVPQSQNHEDL